MKRNLLLLASLFMSISAFAQWERPTYKGAEMKFSSAEVGDTTMYYLYNEDACAFFTQGNSWGTQASYTSENTGLKVMFMKDESDGEWDGKTFFIYSYCYHQNGGDQWRKLFMDNANQMFVDLGAQPNYFWECVQNGDAYRFYGAEKNPEFNSYDYEDCYMGINAAEPSNVLFPLLFMEDYEADGYYVDWKLIPVDAAEELLAKIAPYRAATALKELIDQYSSDDDTKEALKADIDKAEKVYEKSDATEDELKAATSALRLAYNYLAIKGATPDNPKDATGFFKNPDFSDGNANGWDCSFVKGTNVTDLGYQGDTYSYNNVTISGFIQAWANSDFAGRGKRSLGDGRLSQTLPSLPAGKYMFSCDAIAVTQDDVNTPCTGAYLFAESGEYAWQTEIHTGNNSPEHFEFTFVTRGDDVTLGLKTEATTANWIAADNFQLIYYGELEEDPYKAMLDEYIAKIEPVYPYPEDEFAQATVKQAYIDALDAAKNATENYKGAQATLEAAFAAFDSSVKAYAAYMVKINELRDDIASFDYTSDKAAILSDYLMEDNEIAPGEDKNLPNGSACYIINNGTLDEQQLVAEIAWVNQLFTEVVAESLKEGDDCTKMLANPKFDGSFDGWTNKGGGKLGDHNVEVFQDKVDVYQDVNNVPDGLYGITCQAFYRPGGNGSFDGSEPLKVFLYMNDFETPVQHICADPVTEDEAENMVNCFIMTAEGSTDYPADYYMEGVGYIPNSIWGANYAFMGGRYSQTTYGIVQDGKMRIGLTSKGESVEWVLWANFSLTYMGKNEEAVQSVTDSYYDQAINLMEESVGTVEKDALFEAMVAAEGAVGRDQKYEAMLGLISAVKAAKESIAAYEELSGETDELLFAIDEYFVTADESAINEANDALALALRALDNMDLGIDEVKALIERMGKAVNALKYPSGYKDATEENPSDFTALIVNPDFDEAPSAFPGWSGSAIGTGGDNPGPCAEFWNTNFDMYQDILGLPAGFYEVRVRGFYRRGGSEGNDYDISISENPDSALYAKFYATTSVNTYETPIVCIGADAQPEDSEFIGGVAYGNSGLFVPNTMSAAAEWMEGGLYDRNYVIVEVGEDGTLRIGAKKTTAVTYDWVALDCFRLYYLGTAQPGKDPVAIENVANKISVSADIYNLAGQRINSLQKGINIVGGKKVFVK